MSGETPSPPPELGQARARFMDLVAEIRPELHRYCARLTGSIVDGEDVVQDTLAKAYYAISMVAEMPPLRPFLFRIAHNTALDVLRRYERRHVELVAEVPEPSDAALVEERPDPDIVRAALATFLELPVAQRSAVILKDVLGCSLEEIVESTGASLPAVKAALHRGRASLRARAGSIGSVRDVTDGPDRALLGRYATLFNARDWDGLRAFLAEDCRLDLVSRHERRGPAVGEYFSRYADLRDFRVEPGVLDDATVGGRPALAVYMPRASAQPSYFVLLEWRDARVALIRDFRYVPYIADEVRLGHVPFRAHDDQQRERNRS
ncbi:MAG TPA: sigma-70 family RNA polymerase sigma factor [Polyangia bacterium]|nr:sigma-70 family RNA polymerase sigma factor [Polyangia bacterium]